MTKYKIIQLFDNVNTVFERTDNEISSIHFTRELFNDLYAEIKEAIAKAEKYDEALKRIEELEQQNAELLKANSYNVVITNKISAEKHKLELNYKVLVDGVKIVKKNVFIFGNDEDGYELCPKHEYDQCITNQEYKKYNAMLELVEEQE